MQIRRDLSMIRVISPISSVTFELGNQLGEFHCKPLSHLPLTELTRGKPPPEVIRITSTSPRENPCCSTYTLPQANQTYTMSAAAVKLSPALKSLIASPQALGSAIPSPGKRAITTLFDKIRSEGEAGGIGSETWLTVTSAALCTVNSPDSVCGLFDYASERRSGVEAHVMVAAVSEFAWKVGSQADSE